MAQSVIELLSRISVERSPHYVAKLALKELQDGFVSYLYRRRPPQRSLLLNLGCGDTMLPGWINADRLRVGYTLSNLGKFISGEYRMPDWIIDATAPWPCAADYWEGIYTEHMLEHLSYRQVTHVVREALRTLRPGRWLRIIVPDLRRYIEFYNGASGAAEFGAQFEFGAEAISALTQYWEHISVWDGRLMGAVLAEIGFTNISVVSFGQGSDPRLIMDSPGRQWESLYVEAQKPAGANG